MRRVAGAGGVLLLHVLVVTALIRAMVFSPPQQQASPHERMVWLILHPKPQPPKPSEKAEKRKEPAPGPQVFYPDYRTINLPPITGETNPGAIHGPLFDCAPENLANLSPEERTQCAVASTRNPDDTKATTNQPSRAKNAVRWARALQRKQNPTLLPCMPPSLQSIYCAARGISNGGFDLDMEPNYGDTPQEEHVPNNGDPPSHP